MDTRRMRVLPLVLATLLLGACAPMRWERNGYVFHHYEAAALESAMLRAIGLSWLVRKVFKPIHELFGGAQSTSLFFLPCLTRFEVVEGDPPRIMRSPAYRLELFLRVSVPPRLRRSE